MPFFITYTYNTFYVSIYIFVPFFDNSYCGTRKGKCRNTFAIRGDIGRLIYDITAFNFIKILAHDGTINT
jgi:hypothetical protein